MLPTNVTSSGHDGQTLICPKGHVLLAVIKCGGESHRISLSKSGRIALLDHHSIKDEGLINAFLGQETHCLRFVMNWKKRHTIPVLYSEIFTEECIFNTPTYYTVITKNYARSANRRGYCAGLTKLILTDCLGRCSKALNLNLEVHKIVTDVYSKQNRRHRDRPIARRTQGFRVH